MAPVAKLAAKTTGILVIIALTLCRHLGKNVAKTSAFELHVAAAGHAEALLSTTVGFHLRHCLPLRFVV